MNKKVEEAKEILKALGLPVAQQKEIAALTLLALVSIGQGDPWAKATRGRRQVLHQFMQAHIAEYNPFEPDLPTNSPRAHYAISTSALAAIQTYGSEKWTGAAGQFIAEHGSLAAIYARHRVRGHLVPLQLPDGREITLSPGKHNKVQKAIVEKFAPHFTPGAELLYLGDTAKKNLVMEAKILSGLGLSADDHDKLPDVVLLDRKRDWLFLIEAVTSHGPMSPKRVFELENRLKDSPFGRVYISAFPDMPEFRKHMKDIAWETEIWIAEIPDHMIHFNEDKFLGPRST
jgi:type II restriction enzyme